MNDPYRKVHEDIAMALTKLSNMIVWLAKRTLSVKDYMDFADEFTEEKKNDTDEILSELLSKKEREEK